MLAAALLFALPSCSKDDENVVITPAAEVVSAFSQKYPDVKDVRWNILVGAYEAEFIYDGVYTENGQHISLNKVEACTYISQKGKWQRSDFDLTRDYLNTASTVIPQAVREAVMAKGWKVEEVKLFDWADRTDYFYIKFHQSDSELLLNFDGTPVNW